MTKTETTTVGGMVPRLFGTNGVRGVVGKEINVGFAYMIGASLATVFKGHRIIVGRDGRLSGQMLSEAVIAGALSQGSDIDDYGMITTPGLQYLVRTAGGSAGVMVTASHNPPEYNGFKIVDIDGVEISREKEEAIENLIHQNLWVTSPNPGQRLRRERLETYLNEVTGHLDDVDREYFEGMTVVVDAGNGVSSLTTPLVLQRVGCRVITINGNIDGSFPGRTSEPRPDNLGALSAVVIEERADLGIAHDGDGDRSIFVDETGTIHWGDRSFTVIEDMVLDEKPGSKIVTPVNSSMAVAEVARKRSGRLILTKVGSIYVSRTMIKEDALLGGEENGGIFYAPHHPVRDGTMAAILILKAMHKRSQPLSRLLAQLPFYPIAKVKVLSRTSREKERAMAWLGQTLKDRVSSTLDGLKVEVDGRGWVLIRPSGTEPYIRIYAEGRTEKDLEWIISEYKALVNQAVEK